MLLTSPAFADWTLSTAEASPQDKCTLVEWNLKDALAYTSNGGKVTSVSTRQVITVETGRKPGASAALWVLTLRNGDTLYGAPAGMRDQFLQFTAEGLGLIEVPLKVVATLQTAEDRPSAGTTSAAAEPAADDSLKLKNNDVVTGSFVSVTADKITMQLETGPVTIDLARVNRLALGGSVPPRAIPALSAALTFANGSRLTTATFHWTPEILAVNDPAGQERKIDPEQVVLVEILGGRVVPLQQLDPTRDQQVSLLGSAWPTQINRNVTGGPLKVARTVYPTGLGVHTQSTLVYDLDGSFATLSLRCGLDDSALPNGEARPSIVLDGKVIWTPKDATMKAGEISGPITLPIAGGKRLELHADPGARFDILGRFNWIAPALIRP